MIGKFHTWCSHWVPRRPLKVWIFPGQVWAEGSGHWGAAGPEPFQRSLPHFKPFFCCPLLLFLVIIAEEETHLPPQVETIFLCCGDGRALSRQQSVLLRCLRFWALVLCWCLASRQQLEQFQWQAAYGEDFYSGMGSRQAHLRQRQTLGQVYLWATVWFLTAKCLVNRK